MEYPISMPLSPRNPGLLGYFWKLRVGVCVCVNEWVCNYNRYYSEFNTAFQNYVFALYCFNMSWIKIYWEKFTLNLQNTKIDLLNSLFSVYMIA